MTNYERIKNMSVAEMIEFFWGLDECSTCGFDKCRQVPNCREGIKKWLESEAKE